MRLGITVPDLGASQLGYYLVRNANSLLRSDPTADITAFFEAQAPQPLPANFALMPLYEAYGYAAPVVATTFAAARRLAGFPGPTRRLFYVWDLEWTRRHLLRPYREWASVYRDPSLTLVARGEEHARVISLCWNRPVAAVVPDVDLGRLLEVAGA